MKVTLRKWDQPKWIPTLYDVLVDGELIGGRTDYSKGRVLKMGRRYLPILDGVTGFPVFGSFANRFECAEYVADVALRYGLIEDFEEVQRQERKAALREAQLDAEYTLEDVAALVNETEARIYARFGGEK